MGGRLWKIAGRPIDVSQRGMIMGVLNVTPDSFSDGREFFSIDRAIARGLQIAAEGAQIVDVGGESTRPGSEPVSHEEELHRVIPVVEKLRERSTSLSRSTRRNPKWPRQPSRQAPVSLMM
jgi:dihydropteroate synthase